MLHAPDRYHFGQIVAAGITAVIFRRVPGIENGFDFEGFGKDFVSGRLALSRIAEAVSEIAGFQTQALGN